VVSKYGRKCRPVNPEIIRRFDVECLGLIFGPDLDGTRVLKPRERHPEISSTFPSRAIRVHVPEKPLVAIVSDG
jgi:hypothetical protein